MERPWTFHIGCILPELRKVNAMKVHGSIMKESYEEVAKKEEQLLALEKKVEEMKRELEELRKKHMELSLLMSQGDDEK
ncbi:hypothetical protein MLD38_035617 [Melastoma candidum]|uniref:Uncharacterized protein n=1 Tax=Melastoma candidum TaxID=119954 RepID=A0ACB9LIX3_9MYRT|nr:hypothetical protein MLD38_035617 [Melastoma candidum]